MNIDTTVYYPAGGAMRVDGTLYTVLGDQLGSASVTLDAAGDVSGEMRYYPFGETRLAYGSLFIGQRFLTDLGIDQNGPLLHNIIKLNS